MSQSAPQSAPRVGIVVRTRDRPLFVTRALESVLAQTFADWQVMLVNDGGDRAALEAAVAEAGLAGHFEAGRMIMLQHDVSVGRSDAFNRGAAALTTEFVCCLDDDDTWAPEFLDALVDLYDRTRPLAADLGGVASLVSAIREDIQTIDGVEVLVPMGEDGLPNAFLRSDFFLNPIAYATYRHDLYPVQWMLNRQSVLAVGGFPSVFNVMEDRAFMTRFLQHSRLAILDRKLAFHHRRVRRSGDTAQSVAMNTLDNPSYDWRLFSDLARSTVNSPDPTNGAISAEMLRAVAGTLLKEMNDETSALWHKINGESAQLRTQIGALAARLSAVEPPSLAEAPLDARVWDLWQQVGEGDIGFRLGVDTAFLDRLVLSMAETPSGLMLHASAAQHRIVVQVPRTMDWCAFEVSLADLVGRREGLSVELVISSEPGFLFETALSIWTRDRIGRRTHGFDDVHVHSCPPGGSIRVKRSFAPDQLARGDTPRLSLALPRHASNFSLCLNDLVISRG